MNNINYILSILLLFLNNLLFSQFIIKGKVVDEQNQSIYGVNILLKDTINDNIISYAYTDSKGYYQIKSNRSGYFLLSFNLLGFNEKVIKINLCDRKVILKNIVLSQKSFHLNEIILHEKRVYEKKDTITYIVKKYKNGTEEVLEDLLKKLPGVYVDEKGRIKVGNKNIEQLMIDGVNLFDKNYTVLSKNMNIDQISKIELLNNFSKNKLLKDVSSDEKIAMNLVLKKDKKKFFGNLLFSHDLKYKDKYYIKSVLMNFAKKNKTVFITNLNNIGVYSFSMINKLEKDFVGDDLIDIKSNYKAYQPLSLYGFSFGLDQIRTNFNNSKLISLSNSIKISKKTNLKLFILFNNDEKQSYKSSIYNFYPNENPLIIHEGIDLDKQNKMFFTKSELDYDLSNNKNIKLITSYNKVNDHAIKNISYNDSLKKQILGVNLQTFYQMIQFTNKFKRQNVLLINAKYLFEESPQNFILKNFNYNISPEFSQNHDIKQASNDKMYFFDFKSNYIKKINNHLFTFQLANEYRKDRFLSNIYVLNDNTQISTNFKNNINIKTNDLYFFTKHKLTYNKFQFTEKLELHRVTYQNQNQYYNEKYYLSPSFMISWKISDFNNLNFIYSYNFSNQELPNFFSKYILTDYNIFFKDGINALNLTKSHIGINSFYSNFNENFTASLSFNYNLSHNYKTNKIYIYDNYIINEKDIFKNKIIYNALADINYYLTPLSVNMNLKFHYINSNYMAIINHQNSKIRTVYYIPSIEFHSGFIGIFNFDLGSKFINTKLFSKKEYKNYDNKTFLKLFFQFNKKFSINTMYNTYWLDLKNSKNNVFNFLDLGMKYKFRKNKINLSFKAQNIFNTTRVKIKNITNYVLQTSEYNILPRYLLLRIEYKF